MALTLRIARDDDAKLQALLARLPVATRESLARHALHLGLELLVEDPGRAIADPPPPGGDEEADALREAALAYARARRAAGGRALKIAQAREAFDGAVDDWLARR